MQRRSNSFLDMWGEFLFGYIWMNMDFTVLGRTPEGARVCMLVMLQKQRNAHEKEKGLRERRLRKGLRELRTGTRHD